ncbi:MAG TPA: hypothetical protein GXZ40_02765, partial [Bacteroidales bacterium]|nr:hypothetical protein [Bacteroidales bacterium]
MRKIFSFFFTVIFLSLTSFSQVAIVPCGGDIIHTTGSVSYTVGQIDYVYKNTDSLGVIQTHSMWEGVQQVYPVLQLVYDTICPGSSYAENGFNVGPFPTPGLYVDTIFVASVVNAMVDTTIRSIPPDTVKVLYLTVRTLHTLTPSGYNITIIAGNSIPGQYSHTLGNGATSYNMQVRPNNSVGITTITVANSFIYGLNPLTQSGTYYVDFTTIGPGCPTTYTDTIIVLDSLLCEIVDVRKDNSCGQGIGAATAVPSGGSGVYTYLWEPSGQRTARATGLTAGTYVVTVTDHLLGQTVTDTVIIENDLFIVTITADDTTLCGGESTRLYTQITGDDHQFLDYYWTTVGYSGPGTITGRYSDSPTVTVIGDTGQTRVYQVEVTDHHFCTATATITIYIQCETAPSITWNILPNGGTAPVPYDENLAIEISNPQPGNNIDADCGYLYRINGGPWLPWTNTSTPIMIEDNDIFEGEVTFEIKHSDTCSAGMIASYSWEITAPLGSISYVRDSWWSTVCISYDSLRLTNIVLQGFDSSTYIYEWMYAYHFLNGTQESSTWMNLTQLNDNVVNVNTPYIPVDASISQTPTQAGDTIFIFVRAQNTPDGGTTWVTVQTSQARWIIQADPSFDISPLIDGTICESQTHDFSIESSTAGAYTWSYGVAPLYTQNPITGTITEFDYQITSNSTASQLYLYDFNNVNSIEIIALLTPTNGSCPPYIDTALLTVYPEETLTLLTDSSTITQEFCLGNSIDEIRYVWGSGSDSAVLTWNNIPPGVQVTTSGDTLIISGTPTTIGTFLYSVATIGNCTPATATGSIKVNNLPNFTINASNIACHGDSTGSAGVNLYTLTGYEADYTFVWKDVASNIVSNSSQAQNLYAGTYTIEVTHNLTQCSTTDVITITEPASSVSPTVTYTDASCYGGNDGTISTIVNGGTPPYNIYIYDTNDLGSVIRGFNNVPAGVSKTSNNMTAGTYAVYVYDAHNCLFIEEITIASPSELNVDIIRQVDVTCYDSEDGIIEISVTGGTAPYQYFWSNLERTALITDLAPGNYNANITDNNGCETNITVFINRPPRIVTKDTVISCGTYTWNSVSYNNSGRYTQTFTASNGCDSTVTLYLTIIPNTHSDIHVSACGSYTWPLNHVMYTYSGTYSYTIVNGNAQGCDSTVYLHLSIDATATIETSETACGSYTWALNDSTYTQSGIYSHIVASSDPSACDTTYLLYLTINYAGTRDIFVNSCSDYTWDLNQITYNQSGTYSHQLYSGDPNSCDSIIYLHLYIPTTPLSATINSTNILCNGANNGTISIRPTGGTAPYSIFIYDTLDLGTSIRGYTNVAAGTTKTANNIPAGYYVVYIYDNYGCSYTHNVSITEPAQITSQFTVTECNSYTWEGTTYNTSGTYTKTFTAQNGCDSIVTLNLTISPSSNIIINVNACESYTWTANGQTYTQSGSYTHTIPQGNQYGCDSVMTLNLYIPTTPLTATINSTNILCNGANNGTISVRPNGGTAPYSISIYDTQDLGSAIRGYTNVAAGTTKTATNIPAGNYEIHVHDAYGCSYTYSISITEPAPLVVTASIVQPISCYQSNDGSVTVNVNGGKTPYDYLWNTTDTTQTITNLSPGTYTVTVTDSNLCTKTVSITITEPTRITSQFTVTECNSYTWEGTTYNTSGTYTKTLTAHNGCDSVVTLNLTISPSSNVVINVNTCNSYTWTANGQTYTQSGSYTHTIPQGNQYGCDSVMTLNLYIPTTPLTATINSTNILCNGANNGTISVRPNGGTAPYSIYIYDVQDLGSAIRGYTNVAAGTTKTATNIPAGNYEVHVHDTYGCSYTHSISITEPAQISSQFTVTECNSYTWGTTTYNTSGTYTKTFTAQNGCDSIVTLNLTISPSSNVVINVNTCNSYTWTANGQTYTQSGSYTHTIPQGNQYGCDSTITLNLYIPSTLLSANITGTDVRCYGGNDGTI